MSYPTYSSRTRPEIFSKQQWLANDPLALEIAEFGNYSLRVDYNIITAIMCDPLPLWQATHTLFNLLLMEWVWLFDITQAEGQLASRNSLASTSYGERQQKRQQKDSYHQTTNCDPHRYQRGNMYRQSIRNQYKYDQQNKGRMECCPSIRCCWDLNSSIGSRYQTRMESNQSNR